MNSPHRLSVLQHRDPELETCAYCPKLCRAACPVADVEASDTLTPWGQMRAVFDMARGAIEPSPEFAALSYACTSCRNCRESCDHRNPVPETLFEARALHLQRGHAPLAVQRFHARFAARLESVRTKLDELRRVHAHDDRAGTALLAGCDYTLHLDAELDDGVRAARALFGPLRLISGCCGMPLDAAGDPEGARALRAEVAREVKGARRVVALDAGCAFALSSLGAVPFARAAEDVLAAAPARPPSGRRGTLRYHDPCFLARGIGETSAPRALIERVTGAAPAEFSRRGNRTRCSGGGALLPIARPETRARIAADRVHEHERLGGGTIVTACAASLRSLRAAGASVVDLMTIVRELSRP
ncbi:MAG: (Fe-S)-binding protein [Myxococcota bacterium]